MNRFLETIKVGRYGNLANRDIGPFGAGLNVVYGPNEAGKSTIASFVRGVLFGWEEAHGVRNTYRPDKGERSGELVWQIDDSEGAAGRDIVWGSAFGESAVRTGTAKQGAVLLARDENGVSGETSLVNDIDQRTFDAIFSLTSDELRSLSGASDVTARLLTAGSGMTWDPASAFVEVERRIANTSVYDLSTEEEEKREEMKAALERERLYVQEDRELRALKESRATALGHVAELEGELDDLMVMRAELASADKRAEHLAKDRDRLRDELSRVSDMPTVGGAINPKLLALDTASERVLRDRLDELTEEREKIDRSVDAAKENSASSAAAYEALCEIDEEDVAVSRRLRHRPVQAIVSVLLPIAFIVAGIPLFLHGRQINSLSITALGVSLVVVAVFFAAAAFVVLFRQPRGSDQLETRRKDAQWVMLQDKKKLETSLAERDAFNQRVMAFLDDAGLEQAGGSVRQARLLLDEASVVRANKAETAQKVSSLELRIRAAENEIAEIEKTRERIASATGLTSALHEGASLSGPIGYRLLSTALESHLRERTQQRDALLGAINDMSERLGELSRELELARHDRSSDQIKLEYQQVLTRLREAKRDLVSLLLARRMLERSIITWENQGLPEVYACAGSLLRVITAGRWVGISTSRTGSLVAVGADGVERDPRHLSLGTCQQLYLALRLALLITVEGIGRDIPVLADDILVNFDAERRQGAAAVLAELARHRQVIVFTCHKETVSALKEAAPQATCITL